MMNGMMSIKNHNNFTQNLYKILNYTFMKKPMQNTCHKSKNRRSNCCIKDVNSKSSFFMSFPKGFESVMENQVIFQNRRIRTHDFIQRHILSEIYFIEVFINQTTFNVTFICVEIICQKRRVNIFTKLIMIFNIIDDRLYHFIKRRYKIYLYFLSNCFTYLSGRGVWSIIIASTTFILSMKRSLSNSILPSKQIAIQPKFFHKW